MNLFGVLNITIISGHPEMLTYACLLDLLICLISKVFQKLWVRLLKHYDDLKGIRWTWQSLDSISVKAPLGGI